MRSRGSSTGSTLIEVMAVAVILAMGAAVVAASLGSRGMAGGSMRDVITAVSTCDRWARAEALGRRPVFLVVSDKEVSVMLSEAGDVMFRSGMPPRVRARALVDGTEADSIRVDMSGRSTDYEIEYGTGEATRRARVSGVTGWIASEEHE